MTFYYFRYLLLTLLFPLSLFAQDTQYLSQHEVSLNFKNETRWSYNFEVTNRNYLPIKNSLKADHVELTHFTTYQSGFYGNLSLGLRYRSRELFDEQRNDEIRLTQQYAYAKSYNQYRLGHRVRVEERFFSKETAYRLRYRLGLDFPLQGLTLDEGEFYSALSIETLYTLNAQESPEFNQRLMATIGTKLNSALKIQLSLEYRKEDYTSEASNRVFIYTAAKIDL